MKFIIMTIIITFMGIIGVSFADDFPYNSSDVKMNYNDTKMQNIVSPGDSAGEKIRDKYLPGVKNKDHPIVYYVSKVINYFLGMLAFFTFLVITGGSSMTFTGKTDEGIKKGMKFIKMGIIVIIVIGVSWLISMLIFNIYNSGVN